MDYVVAVETARRPEGPEVNGYLRKTVLRTLSFHRRNASEVFVGISAKKTRDKALCIGEPSMQCLRKELRNGRSEFSKIEDSWRGTSYHG